MKKRIWIALILVLGICLAAVLPAAADTFQFTQREVILFEGDTWQAELKREGVPAEEGELTFASGNQRAATVDENGVITAVQKGQSTVTATLKTARRTFKAQITVRVARRVTNVTLNVEKLTVYPYDDPVIFELLQEETEYPVLIVATGKAVQLNTICTPEDASDRNVVYTSSDVGIARIRGRELQGVQPGECDLLIQSRQNPEVVENYHVLVTDPVTRLDILAGDKTVAAGQTLQLSVNYTPAGATLKQVEWSSRAPAIATVDENGLVTGLKKGRVTIDAKAKDGSGKATYVYINVTQTAESLTVKEDSVQVITGRYVTLHAEVLPRETSDRTVSWVSSDESIATVRNGQVKALKAGTCTVTCISNSNPNLTATTDVTVIQPVTRIDFEPNKGISLPVHTTLQLNWVVSPEDATDKTVTFTSQNTRVATVDANGVVTGISRGDVTIVAAAQDGSGRRGSVRVTVTQPVEGVSIQYPVYHIQLHRNLNVRAQIQPSNANDTRVDWSIEDPTVATVRGTGPVGNVYGAAPGTTTVTGVTVDGGFSASAEIRVADFNGAVMLEDLRVNSNDIRIYLRNMGDFKVERVYLTAEVYNYEGNPIPCDPGDPESNVFKIEYQYPLWPGERSDQSGFQFHNLAYGDAIGRVILRITGWKDSEGYTRTIYDEADQPMITWADPYAQPIVPVIIHVAEPIE